MVLAPPTRTHACSSSREGVAAAHKTAMLLDLETMLFKVEVKERIICLPRQ